MLCDADLCLLKATQWRLQSRIDTAGPGSLHTPAVTMPGVLERHRWQHWWGVFCQRVGYDPVTCEEESFDSRWTSVVGAETGAEYRH